MSNDALIDKNFVQIARDLQRLRGIDDDDGYSGSSTDKVERRKTIHNLEKQKQKTRTTGTLDVAFKKRFFNLANGKVPGRLQLLLSIKSYGSRAFIQQEPND